MKRARWFLAAALLLATGVGASGYALLGSKWRTSAVVMHGAPSWNAVGASALSIWNGFLRDLQFTRWSIPSRRAITTA